MAEATFRIQKCVERSGLSKRHVLCKGIKAISLDEKIELSILFNLPVDIISPVFTITVSGKFLRFDINSRTLDNTIGNLCCSRMITFSNTIFEQTLNIKYKGYYAISPFSVPLQTIPILIEEAEFEFKETTKKDLDFTRELINSTALFSSCLRYSVNSSYTEEEEYISVKTLEKFLSA